MSPKKRSSIELSTWSFFPDRGQARVVLSCPDLVIERKKLIEVLARLAAASGARIFLGHQFEGFGRCGKEMVVSLKNLETDERKQVSADILVGADGTLSAVSRSVSRNGHRNAALLQARVQTPDGFREDTCKVWFFSHLTKYFYWLIPESRDSASVGLIADDARRAESGLMAFLKERQLEVLEFQSALVPIYRFEYKGKDPDHYGNIFTVGDAAAQVKTTTVGGVVTGLHGARALANAILRGKNFGEELGKLRVELNFHLLVRQVLNRFNDDDYDELIEMLGGGLKGPLGEWTRDELSKSFFRLIWKEPRLITLGAKALAKSMFP